jgi:hypothetical protein
MTLPAREFSPADLESAVSFIRALPQEIRKVYVDVWEDVGWRFVYGDAPAHVHRILAEMTRGRSFRVRSIDHHLPA